MKINQDNYEHYFLDHAEGSLSPQMEKELEDFLQANPDLRAILDDFDASPLPPADIHIEALNKKLKRNITATPSINEANAEEWMISQMEGLLNIKEETELAEFISLNPAYGYDREKYIQTRLSADLSVTYSLKEQLKKKAPVLPIIRLAWIIPAAVAVILLFFGVRYLLKPDKVITNPSLKPLAEVATPVLPAMEIPADNNQLTKAVARIETPFPAVSSNGNPSQVIRQASIRLDPAAPAAIEVAAAGNSGNISLFVYNLAPVQIGDQKKKSLFSKVVSNLVAQAKDGLGRQAEMNNIEKSDLNLWKLAQAGVNGYNSISDRELELYVHRDEEGKVTSYALIEQDRLLMEKSLDKN